MLLLAGMSGPEAFLLVDYQNDFADPRGSLSVPGGDRILAEVNAVMATTATRGGLVVTTQDWHPADHVSFAAVGGRPASPGRDDLARWPVHCVAGTWGAALADGLDQSRIDHRILKGCDRDTECYSGFGGHEYPDGLPGRPLVMILRAAGVSTLDVAGLATEYCVRATVLDAVALGFRVRVHRGCVRAVDPLSGERALAEMAAAGAQVTASRRLG